MVSQDQLRTSALSFPETEEAPHFEKTSFRVKKKIFATYDRQTNRAVIKLSLIDQDVFHKGAPEAVYPVDNAWGKQGWTFIDLNLVHEELFQDALTTAYCHTAPPKLAAQLRPLTNE